MIRPSKPLVYSLIWGIFWPGLVQAAAFRHPGLLHSQADLDRMRQEVQSVREPWRAGYEVLRNHPQSQATYAMRGPMEMVGRNPTVGQSTYDQDSSAAYQCAIMWCITGDVAYANKARAIINAWSATLKSITGRDAVLMAGLGPFKMVNAAEIIRYTQAGWSEAEIQQAERHFKEVVYPVVKDFALFANGNWDTAAIKTVMAIGVFCNDRAIFERGLRYYVNGGGDGRLTYYIINETGQCQESGRDMPHTQLGLAHLGDCCEIAWNQGLDLYTYANNRLLKGFEYTAEYNLGGEVPFVETLDRTGKYHHTRIAARGGFRPVFEQIYNHYVNRVGIPAPFTQQAAERIRPEGPAQGADHPGFGTLLFTRTPTAGKTAVIIPAAPGAIVAEGSATQIRVTWVAAVGAISYTAKRATASGGPYVAIATEVTSTTYTDANVVPGQVYYYVCSAKNSAGEGPESMETGICAGLPAPWAAQDVGSVTVTGATSFDGSLYTMEGAGTDIGGTEDPFQYAYVPMSGNGTITARYVPQLSSQFTRMGLMIRESLLASAAHASLLVTPQFGGNVEAPGWYARLETSLSSGRTSAIQGSLGLGAPYTSNGRLLGDCWLRLARKGETFTASVSPDGWDWTQVGQTTLGFRNDLLVGLAVCSGLTQVTTTVMFDNVTVPGWPKPSSPAVPNTAR